MTAGTVWRERGSDEVFTGIAMEAKALPRLELCDGKSENKIFGEISSIEMTFVDSWGY